LTVFWLNFRTRHARKSIKGSKDSYFVFESGIQQEFDMQCPHVGSTDNIITIIMKQTPIQGSWAKKAKQNYTF